MGHIPTLHFLYYAKYFALGKAYKQRRHRVQRSVGHVMWQLPNTLERE